MLNCDRNPGGFSLLEVIATITLAAIVTGLAIAYSQQTAATGNAAACNAHVGDIELQAELWLQHTGAWPANNLSDMGGDLSYFPNGLPTCPVDGSAYTLDGSGNVTGHSH